MSIIYINPYRFAPAYDPDAQGFINRVIAADVAAGNTSGLEVGVQDAYNAFVVGCKSDGIWSAIKASCILAGARTLSGALVPLVGAAPTRQGTEGGWNYNRKTGLAGNGTNNYLNSNRNNNADPQNNQHLSCFATTYTSTTQGLIGATVGGTGASNIGFFAGNTFFRSRNGSIDTINSNAAGFLGSSRGSASGYTCRINKVNTSFTRASEGPSSNAIEVYSQGSAQNISNSRLALYSIGEALDLALLDARVTSLINAIAAAIP